MNVAEADIERRLEFWRDLNAYAVSARGELNTRLTSRSAGGIMS